MPIFNISIKIMIYNMRRTFTLILFFTLISSGVFAQSRVFVSGSAVIGYNDISMNIWKYSIENSASIGYLVGASYQYYYQEKYFVKAGMYLQQSFVRFKINNTEGNGTSYTGVLPIELGVKFLEKYEVATGISITNYRDISEFDISSSNNIRTNFVISGSYWINDKWRAELAFSRLLSANIPSLGASSFTSHISLGINYYIF